MTGIGNLVKGTPESSLPFFYHVRAQPKEGSHQNPMMWHPALRLPGSRSVNIIFFVFFISYPVYDTLV